MRSFILLLFIVIVPASDIYAAWTTLAQGMEYGTFTTAKPGKKANSSIIIVRIDPKFWDFVLIGTSWLKGEENQTAVEWCEKHNLKAAINAGMFGKDYTKHVGYLGSDGHINNSHINKYMSVAAFNPKRGKELPEFRIFDLDEAGVSMNKILKNYSSVVQNLRLIKRPGENRWNRPGKMWSEAALGEDESGNALFIFCRTPFTMYDLNQELLSLGIGIVAAQHLEGGPEAQLYVRMVDAIHELSGSSETSFQENNKINPWPIPNIIGVRAKSPSTDKSDN